METCTGVSFIVGPLAGSYLYSLCGYTGTFLVVGSINIVLGMLLMVLFPSITDSNEVIDPEDF
jgi:predicted MFS family arabinose efflux permease